MSLVYKTLFEIKLLHEFYLTGNDGTTIFSRATQQERLDYLQQEFEQGRDSILKDINFQFPESLKSAYNGQDIRLLPSYSGFRVVARVDSTVLPDNSLVFTPSFPLPANIFIRITRKNDNFDRYTQARTRESSSAAYLFSNNPINGTKTFPYLTNEIITFNAFDPSLRFEQGDLASFGANDIREFFIQSSTPQWTEIEGSAFANPNDLLLVPKRFSYSMKAAGITSATFVLKDASGNTIKTTTVTDTTQRTISLDFSEAKDISTATQVNSSGLYTLEITGNGGFSQIRRLAFSDLFDRDDVGLIHIATNAIDAPFDIMAPDGFLVRRINAAGIRIDAPVFEIPFKGRSAFWRYRNDRGKKIVFNPDLTDYLLQDGDFLISFRPLALSKYHFKVKKEGSSDTKFIPNPMDYRLERDSNNRLCFDVMVPVSKLFPV